MTWPDAVVTIATLGVGLIKFVVGAFVGIFALCVLVGGE